MKLLISLIVLFLFSGCDHPEGKNFERNKKVTTTLEEIEANKKNTKENSAFTEKEIDNIENTELPKVEIDNLNVLKMENQNGVKYVWIEINGIRLRFIFDTGASNICISPAEANVLYRQGTLRREDILDKEYFQDATGKISEGTKVNLRTVKIGNKVLENIEATVIDNINAPLLLGQSVLENFGKIEIDNANGQIIFK
jgi:aspartyl protease family protein